MIVTAMSMLEYIPPFAILILLVFGISLTTVAYLILMERKVAAYVQDRLGPNRVGPWGLFQSFADGIKMFVKEDYRPKGTDKVLFSIAPAVMMAVVLTAYAVIPWGGTMLSGSRTINLPAGQDVQAAVDQAMPMFRTQVGQPVVQGSQVTFHYGWPVQIAPLNIGVLFLIAVLSLAVYGVVIGGWASNNKYSFLGGLRATAQMISYEIPLALSLLTVVILTGTLDLAQIVDRQAHYWLGFIPAWNVFAHPLAFVMFLICLHAEANRAPFDLAEAEQELVGGYHTEYTSMRLGLLLLAEYASMIATSAVCVALFFGGWHFPGLNGPDPANPSVTDSLLVVILRSGVYFLKILGLIFVFMWVRWSLPRFRFDQLMMLAWRAMIPLSLAMLLATGLVVFFMGPRDPAFVSMRRLGGSMALVLLAVNVVLIAGAMLISRLLPAPPPTNRRIRVEGSRFTRTPLPASA